MYRDPHKSKTHYHGRSWGGNADVDTHGESCKRWDQLSYGSRFIRSGRKLFGCYMLLKGPSCSTRPAAHRHQPPHEVIRVGVFILGAQLWGVELSCPQDLQDPIQGLCHGHGTAFLRCIDDVDYLMMIQRVSPCLFTKHFLKKIYDKANGKHRAGNEIVNVPE